MSKKISFTAKPASRPASVEADKWVESREKPTTTPEPMKRLTIDVPENLHRRLKIACATRGSNMADEIRALLEKHFKAKA